MNPVVRSFHHAESGSWTHVMVDPATRRAAVVDPVLDFDAASGRVHPASARRVLEYVGTAGLVVDWILETHAHADHLTAAAWMQQAIVPRPRLGIGAGIARVQAHFSRVFDVEFDDASFDARFADGERFQIGDLVAHALATPGHTPDGVSYLVGDAVFVGDTLFAPRAGSARCDFPGGDAACLHASIQRLYALAPTTRVFLAHDYPAAGEAPLAETTIGAQMATKIHVRADTSEAEFVKLRTTRDAGLAVPKLLWPALQVNLRGGRLPPAAANGTRYLRIPLRDDC